MALAAYGSKEHKTLAPLALYTPASLSYRPRPEVADSRAFKQAGLAKNHRSGKFADRANMPALISFPKGLEAGKEQIVPKDKHKWPQGDLYAKLWSENREGMEDQEKSWYASKIMDDMRNMQVDKVTGRVINQNIPFFHRVSSEPAHPAGSRQYSMGLGHALYNFMPENIYGPGGQDHTKTMLKSVEGSSKSSRKGSKASDLSSVRSRSSKGTNMSMF